MKRVAIFAAIVFVVLLSGTLLFSNRNAAAPRPLPQQTTLGTFRVAATEAGTVNVWDDYQGRTRVVARVEPGTEVQLLRREGNGRLILTPSGAEGWVSRDFLIGE